VHEDTMISLDMSRNAI